MAIRGRRHLLILIVASAAIPSWLEDPLWATTRYLFSLTCPVCTSRFEGYGIGSTNTFGGVDRDFLKRAAGYQPISLLPKTCPKCFYSGYEDDFAPAVEISKEVSEQILQQKVLKPMVPVEEGVKPYEIPAYVRYDLIAQTYQLRGRENELIANQFLRASWATRLEWHSPKEILGQELLRKVGDWSASRWDGKEAAKQNVVLYSIQKGREFGEAARSSEGEARMIAALAAIDTLRSYGENTEVQRILPMLKPLLPVGAFSEYERLLNDSIAREQGFQSKAVLLFEQVIQAKKSQPDEAPITYLCGELHRRLGHWDKARFYYKQCLEIEGRPKWLEEWVKEQTDLLPK